MAKVAADLEVEALTVRQIYLTLFNAGVAFFFIFTCYCGLENLQSTMNIESGLGTTSIGVVCGCAILSSLFVGPVLVASLPPKRTLFIAWGAHAFFALANYYPTWATLIPAAILVGVESSIVSIVFGVYVTTLAEQRANLTIDRVSAAVGEQTGDGESYDRKRHNTVVRYGGTLATSFSLGAIAGSLISSLVIGDRDLPADAAENEDATDGIQATISTLLKSNDNISDSLNPLGVCGADHCPYLKEHRLTLKSPDVRLLYIMISIFVAFNICGILVTLFLRPVPNRKDQAPPTLSKSCVDDSMAARISRAAPHGEVDDKPTSSEWISLLRKLTATLRLLTDVRMLLLIPTIILIGVIQSFTVGAFNQVRID